MGSCRLSWGAAVVSPRPGLSLSGLITVRGNNLCLCLQGRPGTAAGAPERGRFGVRYLTQNHTQSSRRRQEQPPRSGWAAPSQATKGLLHSSKFSPVQKPVFEHDLLQLESS